MELLRASHPFKPWFGLDDLPVPLRAMFETVSGGLTTPATGVFSVNGRLAIVLPRCFDALPPGDAAVRAALQTVGLLHRYYREGKQRSVRTSSLDLALIEAGPTADLLAPLESAFLLWEDFLRNGPLLVAARRTGTGTSGRIHWPKTLARAEQLVSRHSVTIARPTRTTFGIVVDHPLTRLHATAVKWARHLLGQTANSAVDSTNPARTLALLDRLEREVYQDRHKRVCQLMRRMSSHSSGPRSAGRGLAHGLFAPDFALIWERMLKVALGPATDEVLPLGRYETSEEFSAGLDLKPDLLIASNWRGHPVILVLDAKHYAEASWPRTESLTKQILYRHMLSSPYRPTAPPVELVGNAFLFPVTALHKEAPVTWRANHNLAGEELRSAPFGRVVCVNVSHEVVAKAYIDGKPDATLRRLLTDLVMRHMTDVRGT